MTPRKMLGRLVLVLFVTLVSTPAATANNRLLGSTQFTCAEETPSVQDAVFARLAAARTPWVRLLVNWETLQPTARGEYNSQYLAAVDRCVGLAHNYGIKVLVYSHGTPAWASPDPGIGAVPDDGVYAETMAYLARHFIAIHQRINAFEVWNEENLEWFWNGTPAQYVSILKETYTALKLVDPKTVVVMGGISPSGLKRDIYLRKLYQAGAHGYFDALATHPYPMGEGGSYRSPPELWSGQIARTALTHKIMTLHGDGSKSIWWTEFGWSALGPKGNKKLVTLQQQAKYTRRAFVYAGKHLPYVKVACLFQALAQPNPSQWQNGLSLLWQDTLLPKPVYLALEKWNVPPEPAPRLAWRQVF